MSPSSSSSSSPESETQTLTLIPGLPNDLSALILSSYIPFSHHSRLKPTCKSWKQLLSSSKSLFSLRQTQKKHLSHLLCIFPQDPHITSPFLFDPENLAWCPLPPLPCNPHGYGLCNFSSISLGHHLYLLGGSLFDTRSFPLDRPSPSSAVFRLDLSTWSWDCLSPMISPRGSFACVAVDKNNSLGGRILVAGGGSRHTMFGAAGSRMSSVEMYDVGKDEWVALDGLPRFRAGCVGFMVGNGEEREFWVMGGYGESRTISGVFPVDEHYMDAVVMELKKNGGRWREIGDMWEQGERRCIRKIVVVEDDGDWDVPGVFMLDRSCIFRYDMASNCWWKETKVPRRAINDLSVGFVALDGELHIITLLSGIDSTERQRSRQYKRSTLFIQIYHPRKKTWRFLITKPPFHQPFDFKTAVMCTIRL